MPSVVISNPQNRVKDCYAPAPKLDLTLRSNGEEEVQVMTSLGEFVRAGIEAPPPTSLIVVSVPVPAVVGTFPIDKYWAYVYVYVAGHAYGLVENAVTGGGSPAPRSNPSKMTPANSTVAPKPNGKLLKVPTSQRSDISHIWIYRTNYFDTAQQAQDNAEGGVAFWIAEVANNPNGTTVSFIDDGSIVGLEQVENDNFEAPQFRYCLYADPYFWGFGNDQYNIEVNFTAAGMVTIIPPSDKWYDGRNSQIISFDGITAGGYDNKGNFYFKQLSNTTGQLYRDILLTEPIGPAASGSTMAHIRGPSTVLYRSKPRNPFAWGFTDLIGEIQVPTLYNFSVGGGKGTAMAVVPNLNLLKLDVESPSKTWTLNLKNAGTPNFETSLRSMSDSFCISTFHSQFAASTDRGLPVLWGIDSKTFSIVECDGSQQYPISSPIYDSMRKLALNEADRTFFHGIFCPRTETNCIFVRTQGVAAGNLNRVFYKHSPTGQWGTLDVFDVLCSSQVFDRAEGQTKVIVGTLTGFIGEMFSADQYWNWVDIRDPNTKAPTMTPFGLARKDNNAVNYFDIIPDAGSGHNNCLLNVNGENYPGLVGNWVTVVVRYRDSVLQKYCSTKKFFAQIASVASSTFDGDGYRINIGAWYQILGTEFQGSLGNPFRVQDYEDSGPQGDLIVDEARYYIGLIEMEVGKVFNFDIPFDYKKLEEIWSSWRYDYFNFTLPSGTDFNPGLQPQEPPWFQALTFIPRNTAFNFFEQSMTKSPNANTSKLSDETRFNNIFALTTGLITNEQKVVTVFFRDRNYTSSTLYGYELRLTTDALVAKPTVSGR